MLYEEAARILNLVESRQGSAKNLIYSSTFKKKGQLQALVYETLKFSDILQQIVTASNLQSLEESLQDVHLTKILVYDALFGHGIEGNGKPERAVKKHSELLQSELGRIKAKLNAKTAADLLAPTLSSAMLPRYVRVNTLKASVSDVIEHFCNDGYHYISVDDCDFEQFRHKARSLTSLEFLSDIHVPELLVFAAGTDFHKHKLCIDGSILLQDKASCLPAVVLSPPRGSQVIDCCAAPGNKASFLAALMNNDGDIFAFDNDASRMSTLRAMLNKTGAKCVSATLGDFRRVDPRDPKYKDVEYVIVDPTCSGSGMVNQIEFDQEHASRNLRSLSNFQAMLVRQALKFPSVRRVVYSTCSVYEQENEHVIEDVVQSVSPEFQLVKILPMIKSRGKSSTLSRAECCVRMSPATTLTIGFFIACLERVGDVSQQPVSCSKCDVDDHLYLTSEATSGEMQIENEAVVSSRKTHKKLKQGRTVEVESDVTAVKQKLRHRADEQLQKTESEQMSVTALKTELVTMEECRKSHKCKKSKEEKTAKFEQYETCAEVSESVQHSLDTPPSTDVIQAEHVTFGDSKKSHKRKKSKKEKNAKLAKLENSGTCSEIDSVQNLLDTHPITDVIQAEHVTVSDNKKSHKQKKSKKEKNAELENSATCTEMLGRVQNSSDTHSITDVTRTGQVTCSDCKKSHKHKKSKKDKSSKTEHFKSDIVAIMDTSERKPEVPTRKTSSENTLCVSESNNDEHEAVKESRKSHKHKKSKREKVEKLVEPKHSTETDAEMVLNKSKRKKLKRHKKHCVE